MLGIGTFAGIIGLGFLSMKNLSKSKQHLKEGIENTKDLIKLVVAKSEENSKQLTVIFLNICLCLLMTVQKI